MLIFRGVPATYRAPVALTIGNFDGVHLGHQAMLDRLERAACALDLPACVLTFEPHPREFFTPDQAPARLTNVREKLQLLAEYGVGRVHLCRFNRRFAATPAEDFVRLIFESGLQAKWVLVGDDFRFGAKRAGDYHMLREAAPRYGAEVLAMESVIVDGIRVSSTAVREALGAGDLNLAARLLGRPYSISGRIVHGDKAGRTLGYPTANIQLKHNKPPLAGVFAVELEGLGDRALPGVASLGVRPTLKNDGKPTLEVHIFDFSNEIYDAHVRVNFLHKLRDEAKFGNLDALKAQIAADAAQARAYFAARPAV